MPEKRLFLKIRDVEHGPLTVAQIKEWIDQGKFHVNDFIRAEDQTLWVMAGNLAHLKRLFDAKESSGRGEAFSGWLTDMQSGKTGMVLTTSGREIEERRLQEERQRLEEQRRAMEERAKELEEKTAVAGETTISEELQAEKDRLEKERQDLEEARLHLEKEEADIKKMGATVKRRARIPIIIGGILVFLALIAGSYYFFVMLPEIRSRIEKIDQAIADNEAKITALEAQIQQERAAGKDTTALQSQLDSLQKQTDELKAQKEQSGGGVGEVKTVEPPRTTVAGKVSLGGVTSITGTGASDSNRNQGQLNGTISAIKSYVAREYSDELKTSPTAAGSVTINFTIGANGQVKAASIVSAFNGRVGSAVKRAILGLSFPPANGDVQAAYTIRFNP